MTKAEDICRDLYAKFSSEEHPDMVLITEGDLVAILKQYGDGRAWEAREVLIAQHDAISDDHATEDCEFCQFIERGKNVAILSAIEEIAVWHEEQASGWQEQASMSHRLTQDGDETETSDHFVQFERYTKYRSLHLNSAAAIRALVTRVAVLEG